MDGGQYATHMIGGTVSNVLGGVKPLKTAVDATSGALSNVMGSVSRLLGKPVVPPQEAMFLYQSVGSIRDMGTREQQEAAKTVLGYVLTNVVLYENEMQQKGPFGLETMRRLNNLAANLKKANASQLDIDYVVKLLSRNYRLDVPAEIESKVSLVGGISLDTRLCRPFNNFILLIKLSTVRTVIFISRKTHNIRGSDQLSS